MFNKRMIILSIILALCSTTLVAKETERDSAAPSFSLTKTDIDLIDKATSRDFNGLNSREKKRLKKILLDLTGVGKSKDKLKPEGEDATVIDWKKEIPLETKSAGKKRSKYSRSKSRFIK